MWPPPLGRGGKGGGGMLFFVDVVLNAGPPSIQLFSGWPGRGVEAKL